MACGNFMIKFNLFSPASLRHFDHHKLWTPSDFPLLIFGYLLDSIKVSNIAFSIIDFDISILLLETSQPRAVLREVFLRRSLIYIRKNHDCHPRPLSNI